MIIQIQILKIFWYFVTLQLISSLLQVHSWTRLDYSSEHAKELSVPPPPSYIEAQPNIENKVGLRYIGNRLILAFILFAFCCFMISLYLYFFVIVFVFACLAAWQRLDIIWDANLFHDFILNFCDRQCGGQRHLRWLQKTLLRWVSLVVVIGENDKKGRKRTKKTVIW